MRDRVAAKRGSDQFDVIPRIQPEQYDHRSYEILLVPSVQGALD